MCYSVDRSTGAQPGLPGWQPSNCSAGKCMMPCKNQRRKEKRRKEKKRKEKKRKEKKRKEKRRKEKRRKEKRRKEKRRKEKKRKEKKRKEKKRKEKKRKEKKRKEKKRLDYAFRRQFNEKPSIIPGYPDTQKSQLVASLLCKRRHRAAADL